MKNFTLDRPDHTEALTKIVLAVIAAAQIVAVAYLATLQGRTEAAIISTATRTETALTGLEQKINSNMEKQILQAISEAITREQLRVASLPKAPVPGPPGPPGPQGIPGRPNLRLPNQMQLQAPAEMNP